MKTKMNIEFLFLLQLEVFLTYLQQVNSLWVAHLIFKCSSIFAQLFVIWVEFEGNLETCVFVFLPDKLENTYQEMLLNFVIASIWNETTQAALMII